MFLDGAYLVLSESSPVCVGDLEKWLNVGYDVEYEVNLDHLYQSSIFDLFLKRNLKGKSDFHQFLSILSYLA